jgi:DNA-binding protein HU-beta
VNRRELVRAVALQSGEHPDDVDAVLKGLTDVVTAVVARGEPVSISGFAKFVKVDRPARMGRNPQTHQPLRIKGSKKAKITPLKGFKDAVIKSSLAPTLERGVWPPTSIAEKTPSKKATAGSGPARKSTARKSTAKKSSARKSTARKTPARKTPAWKSPARKTMARKTTGNSHGGIPERTPSPRHKPRPRPRPRHK